MTFKEIFGREMDLKNESDIKLMYQMLDRLRQDCEAYIRDRNNKLWGITPEEHITAMRHIYYSVPEKPTWVSSAKINEYEYLMKIPLIEGDILSPASPEQYGNVIICHQVNCKGVMGAGLAKQVRMKHPHVYHHYRNACNAFGSKQLGKAQLVSCLADNGYVIANIFGQDGYGRDRCYTDYKALSAAFRYLSDTKGWTIRIPYKMGCGLGGGNWSLVLEAIKTELIDKGCSVEIWKN